MEERAVGPGLPLELLVVARWYPAIDSTARGRFVADQVEALRDRGVQPTIASFEFIQLRRHTAPRPRQAEAIRSLSEAAVALRPDVLSPGGWNADPAIPVARLALPREVPESRTPGEEGEDHVAALRPFVRRYARTVHGRRGIVHAHTGYPDGLAAARTLDELSWPLVITEHSSFLEDQLGNPEEFRRYEEAMRRAARVVAVSEALAQRMRGAIPWLEAKLVVIGNAIPVDEFHLGRPDERRPEELLWVGSLKDPKGTPTLIRAFAQVRSQRPGATLRLVGRAPTQAGDRGLKALASELGVRDAVLFDGELDRPGVARAMAEAALFVHPSRYEPFGVVAAEALASGLPVVATDSGGVTEILGPQPEAHGALVPRDDPEALARAILRSLSRRHEFEPARLREWVRTHYSAETVAQRLTEVYAEVTAEHSQRYGDAPGGRREPAAAVVGGGEAMRPFPQLAKHEAPRPIVVAFERWEAARRLAPLPRQVLGSLTLVTSSRPAAIPLPAGIGSVRAVNIDGGGTDLLVRIVRRLLRAVPAVAARRERERLRRAQAAVDAVLVATSGTGPPDVLCLGGPDYVAVEHAIGAGRASLVPGGVRWLADQWRDHQSSPAPGALEKDETMAPAASATVPTA